jgi:hypothetical protein
MDFAALKKHFDCHHHECAFIDNNFFESWTDGHVQGCYDIMESETENGIVKCNLIYQMLRRRPTGTNVLLNGLKAIDYQCMRGLCDPNLFDLVQHTIVSFPALLTCSIIESPLLLGYFPQFTNSKLKSG